MPIDTATYPGAPGGMNVNLSPEQLDDTEARYILDGLVNQPGVTVRRGPLTPVSGVGGMAALTRKASGLVFTRDPVGSPRYAALTGDNANGFLSAWSADLSTIADIPLAAAPLPNNPGGGQPYRYVDIKAAIGGGVWIGITSAFDQNGPAHSLIHWRGGNKLDYTTGTITVARGSTSVTGSGTSWVANAAPGMFLFANSDGGDLMMLIGVVKTVNSNTSISLEKPALANATGKAYKVTSVRGFAPRITTGRITADTTKTGVTGGNTRFKSQGLGQGTWSLHRQSNWDYIGTVSSVQSEFALQLTGLAQVSVADEPYIAIQRDADLTISATTSKKVGLLTASYAQRQWYAYNGWGPGGYGGDKTYRLWYSDTVDQEAVDISDIDGQWFPIPSSRAVQEPIRGLAAAHNSLLVMKETETFGVFGSSPASFQVKKLADDGVISPMTVQSYNGGVVWAGRDGIQWYDGVQVTNLTEAKFGNQWRKSLLSFDPSTYRMWSMIVRNQYVLFIENLTPTFSYTRGGVTTTPSTWTVFLDLDTGAVTMHSNLHFRGAVQRPADTGNQVWFIVNDSTKGRVCSADAIFDSQGNDSFACDGGGVVGPDFFFESKKFNFGDALQLKRIKQLALYYVAAGANLIVDTVLGLDDQTTTLTTQLLPQATLLPKRIRFLKRSQHFAFRLYQSSSAVTSAKLGAFQVGFKLMRKGRV